MRVGYSSECARRSRGLPTSSGVFPNAEALVRLAGAVPVEQYDECATVDRRYFVERSMNLVNATYNNMGGRCQHQNACRCNQKTDRSERSEMGPPTEPSPRTMGRGSS